VLRLNGAEWPDVLRHGNQKEWGVGARMIRKYCEKADLRIAAQMEKDRSKLLSLHVARRVALFQKAVEDHDLRTAAMLLKDLGQLQTVSPPKQVKLEDATTPQVPLSPEERDVLLAKLHERAAAPPPPPTPPGFASDANGQPRPIHPT